MKYLNFKDTKIHEVKKLTLTSKIQSGGTFGLLSSLNFVSPYLSPPHAKLRLIYVFSKSIPLLYHKDLEKQEDCCTHCDTWLSVSVVRHHITPFLLFYILTVEKLSIAFVCFYLVFFCLRTLAAQSAE